VKKSTTTTTEQPESSDSATGAAAQELDSARDSVCSGTDDSPTVIAVEKCDSGGGSEESGKSVHGKSVDDVDEKEGKSENEEEEVKEEEDNFLDSVIVNFKPKM